MPRNTVPRRPYNRLEVFITNSLSSEHPFLAEDNSRSPVSDPIGDKKPIFKIARSGIFGQPNYNRRLPLGNRRGVEQPELVKMKPFGKPCLFKILPERICPQDINLPPALFSIKTIPCPNMTVHHSIHRPPTTCSPRRPLSWFDPRRRRTSGRRPGPWPTWD